MLERIQQDFNGSRTTGTLVSLADLIILGGCAAVERAAKQGGHDVKFPFTPGRTDATAEQTDTEAFAVLEPTADRFRNDLQKGHDLAAEHLLVDTAFMLTLSAPQMTALVGGLRVLNSNAGQSAHGVVTDRPETLTNDLLSTCSTSGWCGRRHQNPPTCSAVAIAAPVSCDGPEPGSTSSSYRPGTRS